MNDRFETLVRSCHAEVYRSALRVLRDPDDALDVTQQVYMAVVDGHVDLDAARDRCGVLRWLAAKKSLEFLRSRRSRRTRERDHAMKRDDITKETEADSRDERRAVTRSLEDLPDDLRLPVVLRFQEGLTFARVAECLGCSIPAAHARVQRALDRMRGDLSRAGFAGMAVALPDVLGQTPSAPVPAGLESQLLTLGRAVETGMAAAASTNLFQTALVPVSVLVVVAAIVGGFTLLGGPDEPDGVEIAHGAALVSDLDAGEGARRVARQDPPPTTGTESTGTPTREAAARPPLPRPALRDGMRQDPAPKPDALTGETGVIEGRIVDTWQRGLAGIKVWVSSHEYAGKRAKTVVETKADEWGRYRVTVPANAKGLLYAVVTNHPHLVTSRREGVRVRTGDVVHVEDIVVEPDGVDRDGEFTLSVSLRDEDGEPVFGVVTEVHRRFKNAGGRWVRARLVKGLTDATGHVELTGSRVGEMLLTLKGRRLGWQDREIPLTIAAGTNEHEAVMLPAQTISGTVDTIDGAIPRDISVGATCPDRPHDWVTGRYDATTGRFTVEGLADGLYTVSLSNVMRWGSEPGADEPQPAWSRAKKRAVRAGTEGLRFTLKRRTDVRDVGDHGAEIHATLRWRDSGKPHRIHRHDIDIRRLPADVEGAALLSDVLPNFLKPSLAQKMADRHEPTEEVHIDGLDAGHYLAVALGRGYAPVAIGPFRLGATEIRDAGVVGVGKGAQVKGRVLDARGRPAANAYVIFTGVGPYSDAKIREHDAEVMKKDGRGTMYFVYAKTDRRGVFKMTRVPAGHALRFAALHADGAPGVTEAMTLSDGQAVDDMEIRLEMR